MGNFKIYGGMRILSGGEPRFYCIVFGWKLILRFPFSFFLFFGICFLLYVCMCVSVFRWIAQGLVTSVMGRQYYLLYGWAYFKIGWVRTDATWLGLSTCSLRCHVFHGSISCQIFLFSFFYMLLSISGFFFFFFLEWGNAPQEEKLKKDFLKKFFFHNQRKSSIQLFMLIHSLFRQPLKMD